MVSQRKAPIYLAGDAEACKAIEPVVKNFAEICLYFGPFGAASKIKFVNNLLVTINTAAIGEAVSLALKAGVDPEMMIKAITDGSGGSVLFPIRAPRMVQKNFCRRRERSRCCPTISTTSTTSPARGRARHRCSISRRSLYERGIKRGLGEHDVAAVIEVIDDNSRQGRRDLTGAGRAGRKSPSHGRRATSKLIKRRDQHEFQPSNSPAMYFGTFSGAPARHRSRQLHRAAVRRSGRSRALRVEDIWASTSSTSTRKVAIISARTVSIRTRSFTPAASRGTSTTSLMSYATRRSRRSGELLAQSDVKPERVDQSPLWRHGPALRFRNPSGQTIELTTGVNDTGSDGRGRLGTTVGTGPYLL